MPPNRTEYQQALRGALRDHLGGLLTEPLTIGRLAEFFNVSRNKMPQILKHISGAEQLGGLWRIPLKSMPVAYHREHGLIPPL